MISWCIDQRSLLALYLGFAACGGGQGGLQPCDPDPDPTHGLPQITAISPTSGPPGTVVTLTGVNFDQVDTRFEAAYGDFSLTCDHGTMDGTVVSATQIDVTIPEGATLSGYIYLVAEGVTVARGPQLFELEAAAYVTVHNESQFPLVTASASWEPLLAPGERIDVDDSMVFQVSSGPLHLELCAGAPVDGGELETWACVSHDGRLDPNASTEVTVSHIPTARFIVGDWVATWQVGEDTFEERLHIDGDGYWEIRYAQRVVESGVLVESEWPPYARDFSFALRPNGPQSEATVPVRSFTVMSPRAGDRVSFYRPEQG